MLRAGLPRSRRRAAPPSEPHTWPGVSIATACLSALRHYRVPPPLFIRGARLTHRPHGSWRNPPQRRCVMPGGLVGSSGEGARMKILAIEHELPGAEPAAFRQYSRAEARRAWDLQQAGLLRELYFRVDRDQAVLVLECADMQAAREALNTLPFVQHGLIEFELIPLRAYPGFARLFTEDAAPPGRVGTSHHTNLG